MPAQSVHTSYMCELVRSTVRVAVVHGVEQENKAPMLKIFDSTVDAPNGKESAHAAPTKVHAHSRARTQTGMHTAGRAHSRARSEVAQKHCLGLYYKALEPWRGMQVLAPLKP